jgi:hypothetical protein
LEPLLAKEGGELLVDVLRNFNEAQASAMCFIKRRDS